MGIPSLPGSPCIRIMVYPARWMLTTENLMRKVAPYRNHNDKKYTKKKPPGFMNESVRRAG